MAPNDFDALRGRHELIAAQSRLVEAVLAPPGSDLAAMAPQGLTPLPGIRGGLARALGVYRSGACVLSERVLTPIYPRLRARMEAQDAGSFAALAWSCWRQRGPSQADLGEWGEALIDRLAQAERDGLPAAWTAIARLEWALHQAERQPESRVDLGSLALLGRLPQEALRLTLSESVVLQPCEGVALREVAALPDERFGKGPRVALMVWREGWRGRVIALDMATLRWCEALRGGLDLERALMAAGPGFDFCAWLPAAVRHGWLGRVESIDLVVSHPLIPRG
ncbi:MAG: hypothetical protein J7598_12175 [Mitsuaria chitosanitabida]|uniref:hypothetical protein n=1 Tax=Roseateles chitosanitabidus TaxID=65048 RepID=UPI001AFD428A|nr:hypothetical protein [Roseateles chitosanitabidus]MBO9687362.1 hypothetical protein [Roseateles chitosanitabidus]